MVRAEGQNIPNFDPDAEIARLVLGDMRSCLERGTEIDELLVDNGRTYLADLATRAAIPQDVSDADTALGRAWSRYVIGDVMGTFITTIKHEGRRKNLQIFDALVQEIRSVRSKKAS